MKNKNEIKKSVYDIKKSQLLLGKVKCIKYLLEKKKINEIIKSPNVLDKTQTRFSSSSLVFLNQGLTTKNLLHLRSYLGRFGLGLTNFPVRIWSKMDGKQKLANQVLSKYIYGNLLLLYIKKEEKIRGTMGFPVAFLRSPRHFQQT